MNDRYHSVVIGGGLMGIGVGCFLKKKGKSFILLEARSEIGGVWSQNNFPGLECDTDAHFYYSFAFKPLTKGPAFVSAPSFRQYLSEVVDDEGIAEHIRTSCTVTKCSWNSESCEWRCDTVSDGKKSTFVCSFLFMCVGYLNSPKIPQFEGREKFGGPVFHPMNWVPIETAGKNIAIIGSGATSFSLQSGLKDCNIHIIQRSKPCVFRAEILAQFWNPKYGTDVSEEVAREYRVKFPFDDCLPLVKENLLFIKKQLEIQLGVDVCENSFLWEPNNKRPIRLTDSVIENYQAGRIHVYNSGVKCFNAQGILLESGVQVNADFIITATSYQRTWIPCVVDGKDVAFLDNKRYLNVAVSNLPNFFQPMHWYFVFGFLEVSTRFAEIIFEHMEKHNLSSFTPKVKYGKATESMKKMEEIISASSRPGQFYPGRSTDCYIAEEQRMFQDRAPWSFILDSRTNMGLLDCIDFDDPNIIFKTCSK